MTENTLEDTARALQTRDTLDGSCTLGGEEHQIRVREPTLGELDELEAELADDAGEEELFREFVSRYLVAPDIDPADIGISKLRPLFEGMQAAFADGDVFEDAEDAMPLNEGNA